MKRIATTIPAAIAALVLGATLGFSASGHAAPGVTHHKLRNVLVGERKSQVEASFGSHGVKFGTGATNRYGTRTIKAYRADATHTAWVTYLHVKGTHRTVVIDATWCSHPAGRLGCS